MAGEKLFSLTAPGKRVLAEILRRYRSLSRAAGWGEALASAKGKEEKHFPFTV